MRGRRSASGSVRRPTPLEYAKSTRVLGGSSAYDVRMVVNINKRGVPVSASDRYQAKAWRLLNVVRMLSC